jgi:hypothetical protein
MSLLAALVFLSGTVVLLVGAARVAFALRALLAERGPLPPFRQVLPTAGWLSLALYGLLMASAGMLLAR